MDELICKLKNGARNYGINLSDKQCSAFMKYSLLLKEWNEKINLTSITDDDGIITKHFLDSLSIFGYISSKDFVDGAKNIIDVGTGAGFPGIPIKIVKPNMSVTLMDSTDKKIKFLQTIIRELGLSGINCIHFRAEDAGHDSKYREKYDISIARAVARLPILLEYCLPFVKVGGIFIAMKGSDTDEIKDAAKALSVLGGEIERKEEFVLPNSDIIRNIIIVRKFRQIPAIYPRKAGTPSKSPIN